MGVSRYLSSRLTAAALAAGMVLASAGGTGLVRAADPVATPVPDPAGVAAGWLATQVAAGGLPAGSLADAIFAFAGAGAGAGAAADALAQLEPVADAYMGYGGTLKPGAVAKVMLAVITAGGDPNAFNGHDLEADLRGLQASSGADAGQFTGAAINDQALAILALAATPSGVPAGAGEWLAGRQCTAGDYSWDGTCPVAAGSEDPDTTALALQGLLAAGSDAAAAKGTAWLKGQQGSDGSFSAYGSANANSSGAAAQALRAAGETDAADAAATFVASLQYGCDAAADVQGAIPYTSTDPGYGGPLFSTTGGILAFGAGRYDELRIEGAASDTPVLDCSVASPSPAESVDASVDPGASDAASDVPGASDAASDVPTEVVAGASGLPSQPATDATAIGGPSTGTDGLLVLMASLVAVTGLVLAVRRPGRAR